VGNGVKPARCTGVLGPADGHLHMGNPVSRLSLTLTVVANMAAMLIARCWPVTACALA